MGATRNVAKNTFLLTIGLLSGRILALFVFRNMTSVVGPEGVGIWGFANDLTAILLVITNFGLGTLLTREVTKARGMTWPILWAALRIRWILGGLCYVFLLFYLHAEGYGELTRLAVLVTAVAVFIEATSMACDAILQAHEKVQYQTLGQVVSALAYFGLAIWWLDAGYGVMGVIWANLVSRVLRLVIMAPLMFWKTGPWRWRPAPDQRGPSMVWLLKLGLPLFLSTTFGIVSFKVDTVMLVHQLGEAVTGIYVLGHRALDYLLYLPNIFATALFPALARYATHSHGDAARLGERSLRYMMIAMLPLTLFVMAVARPIIHWFDPSPRFDDSILVLQIVIWGVPLQAANVIFNRLIMTAEKERTFVVIGLAAMVVNVSLNLLLIPRYGYFGASVATVISLTVSCLLHVFYLHSTPLRPRLVRAAGGPVLALAGSWLVTLAVGRLLAPGWQAGWLALPLDAGWGPFLALAAVAVGAYLGLIFVLRILGVEDLRLLRQLRAGPKDPH